MAHTASSELGVAFHSAMVRLAERVTRCLIYCVCVFADPHSAVMPALCTDTSQSRADNFNLAHPDCDEQRRGVRSASETSSGAKAKTKGSSEAKGLLGINLCIIAKSS